MSASDVPRGSRGAVAPHLGPVRDETGSRQRDRFDAAELGIVLSHYELGVIRRIREHRRGSRRSPKVRVSAERGEFLLKRRGPGRDDPGRVCFAQSLQLRLAKAGYPVPGLLTTRSSGSPMLQLGGRIYEMFRFVRGRRDDRSPRAAQAAGSALGMLHRLLGEADDGAGSPLTTYHAAAGFDAAVARVPHMARAADEGEAAEVLQARCTFLSHVYLDAGARAERAGLAGWPRCVIHGDWHPGNLLYRHGRVVAVLDFDSARVAARVLDVANAALQFSMLLGDPDDPDTWPDQLDAPRIRALLGGYHETAAVAVSAEEIQALPWLILEALILEAILPIAATGRFARISGGAFLRMIERKVRWLRPRASKLARMLG